MAPITARELNRATLSRQGLLEPITARSAGAAVERLGSLQAQHPEWPPDALAARAANTRTADLAGALTGRLARADRLALESEAERMRAIVSSSA